MGAFWNRLNEKQKKIASWLGVGVIVGVGLLLLQPPNSSPLPAVLPAASSQEPQAWAWSQEELVKELEAILNSMLGGKGAKVFLTMERGHRLQIAYDRTEEERRSTEGVTERRWTSSPVLMRNDAERKEVPLVLEEIEPTVRGVLVVVDQTPRAELRLAISQAVATALQVPMYRIEVLFKQ